MEYRIGRHFQAITTATVQFKTQLIPAPGLGYHPGTIEERRLVTDMLTMTAIQVSDPVAEFILMVTANGPFQGTDCPGERYYKRCSQSLLLMTSLNNICWAQRMERCNSSSVT